ncbi:MAG: hypothetical protein KA761_02035 [Gemmatimonadaceae bacterium]|nr:hypothetical protein [Gemmatimonadaceae bacterium]
MTRTVFIRSLIPLASAALAAASCAGASAAPGANGSPTGRVIAVGDGITLPAGPVLTALPPGQRYRFVPPDSLASGLAADDVASMDEPTLVEWRTALARVLSNGGWVASADSAAYDVTIFSVSRLGMRRASRVQLAANVTSCGDVPTTQLQLCTDDPLQTTEEWSTSHATYHVIRRRSDGAVRGWAHGGIAGPGQRSRVGEEVGAMLRAGAAGEM